MNQYIIILLIIVVCLIAIGVVYLDPIPATEDECNRMGGGNEHVRKWCDCKTVWVGGSLNKSSTECHVKQAGEP